MPELGIYPFRDGHVALSILNADVVRAWHADTGLPIPLDSLDRWHMGGLKVPPEATSVRLRIEADGITTLATATWSLEEAPDPTPKPKRLHRQGGHGVALAGPAGGDRNNTRTGGRAHPVPGPPA